jgi:hypothetical protein
MRACFVPLGSRFALPFFVVPLALLLGSTGCAPEDVPENQPPTCLVTAPVDGTIFASGEEVALEATVTDPEDEYLSIYWTSTASGPIADGAVTSAFLPVGSQILTVQALDQHGNACDDSVTVTQEAPAD